MELVASQRIIEGKKCEGKGGRKVVGWSTKEMDQKVSNLFVKMNVG